MEKDFDAVIARYKEKLLAGASLESIIRFLHDDGLTIIESMEAVRTLYSVSLGEAKQLVSGQPCWNEVVVSHQAFHQALEDALFNEMYQIGDNSDGLVQIKISETIYEIMYNDIKERIDKK